jgi:hypothetical protein
MGVVGSRWRLCRLVSSRRRRPAGRRARKSAPWQCRPARRHERFWLDLCPARRHRVAGPRSPARGRGARRGPRASRRGFAAGAAFPRLPARGRRRGRGAAQRAAEHQRQAHGGRLRPRAAQRSRDDDPGPGATTRCARAVRHALPARDDAVAAAQQDAIPAQCDGSTRCRRANGCASHAGKPPRQSTPSDRRPVPRYEIGAPGTWPGAGRPAGRSAARRPEHRPRGVEERLRALERASARERRPKRAAAQLAHAASGRAPSANISAAAPSRASPADATSLPAGDVAAAVAPAQRPATAKALAAAGGRDSLRGWPPPRRLRPRLCMG